jgi:hypothetical protein
VPTREATEQPAGLAWKVTAGHAFWSVVRREGNCLGNWTATLPMFA